MATVIALAVAAGTVAMVGASSVPAQGAVATATSTTSGSGEISADWNGPTYSLTWQNGNYSTVTDSFIGTPVSVPGDSSWRTLTVKNDGPSAATVTVNIIDATITNPASAVNTELADIIELEWAVDSTYTGQSVFSRVAAGDPLTIASFDIAQGASFPLMVGYSFPVDSTGGRNMGDTSQILSFSVSITMAGATSTSSPAPSPTPVSPSPASVPLPSQLPSPAPPLPGLVYTGTSVTVIGLVALGLLTLGWIVLAAKRHRRDTQEETSP